MSASNRINSKSTCEAMRKASQMLKLIGIMFKRAIADNFDHSKNPQ